MTSDQRDRVDPAGEGPTSSGAGGDGPAAGAGRAEPAADAGPAEPAADAAAAAESPRAAADAATDVRTPDPIPDEETLRATATPASVRRAPRYGAFVRTGVLLGGLIGWLLAILFTGTTGEGRTGVILLTTVALAGLGALVGAGLASLADRRSPRSVASGARDGRRTGRTGRTRH